MCLLKSLTSPLKSLQSQWMCFNYPQYYQYFDKHTKKKISNVLDSQKLLPLSTIPYYSLASCAKPLKKRYFFDQLQAAGSRNCISSWSLEINTEIRCEKRKLSIERKPDNDQVQREFPAVESVSCYKKYLGQYHFKYSGFFLFLS